MSLATRRFHSATSSRRQYYQPERSPYSNISAGALIYQSTSRIENLARPKLRRDSTVRDGKVSFSSSASFFQPIVRLLRRFFSLLQRTDVFGRHSSCCHCSMYGTSEDFGDAFEALRQSSMGASDASASLKRRDAFSGDAAFDRFGRAEEISDKLIERNHCDFYSE